MDARTDKLQASEVLDELAWLQQLARTLAGGLGFEDDLVQNTWLAAHKIDGGVSRAWLVRTMRNLTARWHRRESRLRQRERAVARVEAIDSDALIERSEILSRVLDSLRALDEPLRTALLLIYQENLSIQAAAARLGIPADTLRWQRREGLKRLRRTLDQKNIKNSDWRCVILASPALTTAGIAEQAIAKQAAFGPLAQAVQHTGRLWMTWKLSSAALIVCLAVGFVIYRDSEISGVLEPTRLATADAIDSIPVLPTDAASPGAKTSAQFAAPSPKRSVVNSQPRALQVNPSWKGRSLMVKLIDRAAQAVVGAKVWIGESAEPQTSTWISDPRGQARIPRPKSLATISASADGLYGKAAILPQIVGDEMQLVLLPDADLDVLLVDALDRPVADIPMAIITRNRKRGHLSFHNLTRTDRHGRARLRHVLNQFAFAGDAFDILAGPAVLLRHRPDIELAAAHLPSEVLRFVMPPTGSLRVKVLDQNGAPNRKATELRLAVVPQNASPSALDADGTPSQESWSLWLRTHPQGLLRESLANGQALIDPIGLGLQLVARAPRAEATDTSYGFAQGPERANDQAELVIRPLSRPTVITGIAQEEGGRPLAHQTLALRYQLAAGPEAGQATTRNLMNWGFNAKPRTDAEGRFRVLLDDDTSRIWMRASQRSLRWIAAASSGGAWIQAEVKLPDQLTKGDNDLGILRGIITSPTISGQAIDTSGAPVAIESVALRLETQERPRQLRYLSDSVTILDANRFAIFARLPAGYEAHTGPLQLWAEAANKPRASRTVAQGSQGITIRFRDSGTIAGTLRTAPGKSPMGYSVRFAIETAEGRRHLYGFAQVAPNGSFQLTNLPRQRGDVEVLDISSKELVTSLLRVQPAAAGEPQDQRLQQLSMQGLSRQFGLEVLDDSGAKIAKASFDSPQLGRTQQTYDREAMRFSSQQTELTGTVQAPGYRATSVKLAPGNNKVVLQRGLEISLRLTPSLDLPKQLDLVVRLVGMDHREEVRLTKHAHRGYSGYVSRAGKYEARGQLLRSGVEIAEFALTSTPLTAVEVKAGVSTQEVSLRLDRSQIEAWSRQRD